MISILPALKFIQLAMNAVFMALSGAILSSQEFSILVTAIFSVSAYSLIENVIFYSSGGAKRVSIKKLPLLLVLLYLVYILTRQNDYDFYSIVLIVIYVIFRYLTTLHEHLKENFGFGIQVSMLRIHASIIHLVVAIFLLWLNASAVLVAYFIGGLSGLLYTNFTLLRFKSPVLDLLASKNDNVGFSFKILFSSLSGYLVNYYFLMAIKQDDVNVFNQVSVAVSLYSSVVAVLLSESFAKRASQSQELRIFDKLVFISLLIIFMFSLFLVFLKHESPIFFSQSMLVEKLHEKLPEAYVTFFSCIVFALQLVCANLAIKIRSHRVEPVFFANLLIVFLVFLNLFFEIHIDVKGYFLLQMLVNFAVLTEILFWLSRIRRMPVHHSE